MKRLFAALLLVASVAAADVATIPTNLSPRGVSDWAIVGGWVGSGTGALPAAGATGSYFIDISTPTAPILYRSDGSAWRAVTSTVTDSSASLTAHIATQIDPHGASQTVSQGLQLGSGTADLTLDRPSSGTLRIASYVVLVPETATPSDALATGTLWYDGNTGKLRCYDGATWNDCW